MERNTPHTPEEILPRLKEWFESYTASFLTGASEDDRNIFLKQHHTKRVCRESLFLAEQLGLSANQTALCELAALFHDIGRFEQYRRFRTFVDSQSADHARLGCDIIREEGCLDRLAPEDGELIRRVVLYHNRAALPEDETEECLFYARLLRDADKLDIWRVVTTYYRKTDQDRNRTLELGLPDTPGISDKIHDALMKRQLVLKEHMENLNDFKLLQMGWVFDLNFAPAIVRLAEKGYLEMIRETLPQDHRIDAIYGAMTAYMKEKAASGGQVGAPGNPMANA